MQGWRKVLEQPNERIQALESDDSELMTAPITPSTVLVVALASGTSSLCVLGGYDYFADRA